MESNATPEEPKNKNVLEPGNLASCLLAVGMCHEVFPDLQLGELGELGDCSLPPISAFYDLIHQNNLDNPDNPKSLRKWRLWRDSLLEDFLGYVPPNCPPEVLDAAIADIAKRTLDMLNGSNNLPRRKLAEFVPVLGHKIPIFPRIIESSFEGASLAVAFSFKLPPNFLDLIDIMVYPNLRDNDSRNKSLYSAIMQVDKRQRDDFPLWAVPFTPIPKDPKDLKTFGNIVGIKGSESFWGGFPPSPEQRVLYDPRGGYSSIRAVGALKERGDILHPPQSRHSIIEKHAIDFIQRLLHRSDLDYDERLSMIRRFIANIILKELAKQLMTKNREFGNISNKWGIDEDYRRRQMRSWECVSVPLFFIKEAAKYLLNLGNGPVLASHNIENISKHSWKQAGFKLDPYHRREGSSNHPAFASRFRYVFSR